MLMSVGFVVAMATPPEGGPWWTQFVLIGAIVAIMYFIMLRPMRQKEQKAQEFRESLKVGDRVITTSGIYGQVTRLGDESLQLQIADKIRIEIARAAIGGYQGKPQVVEPAPQ